MGWIRYWRGLLLVVRMAPSLMMARFMMAHRERRVHLGFLPTDRKYLDHFRLSNPTTEKSSYRRLPYLPGFHKDLFTAERVLGFPRQGISCLGPLRRQRLSFPPSPSINRFRSLLLPSLMFASRVDYFRFEPRGVSESTRIIEMMAPIRSVLQPCEPFETVQ